MVNKWVLFVFFSLVFFFIGFMVLHAFSADLDRSEILYGGSDVLRGDRTSFADDAFVFDIGRFEELKKQLESEIRSSGEEVGLALKDLESGEELLVHAEEMMHAASLMKVPVMIEVFKKAARGKFSLEDKILVENRFESIVDESPYSLMMTDDSDDDIYRFIGKELSIRDLVERMVTVSSNLATNILIELVGAKNVMKTMDDLGIHYMEVLRGVEDTKAYERGLNNRTDALSMMQVMLSVAEGKAGSAEDCQEMVEILSQQKFRAKIPAGIPKGVRVANKTGSITRIDHDAAIVFPEGRKPYVLVVLTRGMEVHEDAERLIAKMSRLVYEYLAVNETKKEREI